MKVLLDANVLIAILDKDHQKHTIARHWLAKFLQTPHNIWLSCDTTQLACLRVLSMPSYPNNFKFEQVVAGFNRFTSNTHHEFIGQSLNLMKYDLIDWRHLQGHRQLTDAYLLALAVQENAQFVTFDNPINYRTVKNATPDNLLVLDI